MSQNSGKAIHVHADDFKSRTLDSVVCPVEFGRGSFRADVAVSAADSLPVPHLLLTGSAVSSFSGQSDVK